MQEEIHKVVNLLNRGKVILYPTDTIWGLGCKATNPTAISKLKDIKERQEGKNLIILVSDIEMIKRYVTTIPQEVEKLIHESNNPITIIYPEAKNLPIHLLSQNQSIGIRIPHNTFCQQLIKAIDSPLVSTSANISGEPSPQTFQDISPRLIARVDYTVPFIYEEQSQHTASSIYLITPENSIKQIR